MASLGLIGMVGGVGGEMVKQADEERRSAANRDFETWRMEVLQGYKMGDENRADKRAIAAEDRKTAAADKARTDQTERIGAKAGEIADTQVGRKRGLVESGIADRSAWTEEQQAAVDESLSRDRSQIAEDPETRIRAAAATGDLSLKDQATLHREERRLDASERKTAASERTAEMRDATQRYIAELRDKQQGARLEALIRKTGSDNNGTREALSFLEGARKELSSEEQTLRQLYQAELRQADKYDPEAQAAIKAQYEPKLVEIAKRRKEIQSDYDAVRTRVGLPERAPAKPEPTKPTAAVPSLPAGAKKIGTSGGKAVYETPDGKRFIEN